MAEENTAQEPEQAQRQEQGQVQGEGQEQGQGQEQREGQEQGQDAEPAEKQPDKPAGKKSGEGLLLPILYALLAAVGAFTLVMIIGIVVTFITRPAQPSQSPSAQPSSRIASETYAAPDQAWEEAAGSM